MHLSNPSRAKRPALLTMLLAAALLASPAAAIEEGDKAPGFRAPALDGPKSLSLTDYRGKVVYLDFWASWCAPCATALPVLDSFRDEFGSDEFQVLAVNVDNDPEKARKFLKKRPVGYPSVLDPKGKLPEQFGVQTMPTSFLIDRKGVVRYVHKGFRRGDEETLREHIAALVAQR